MINFEEELKNFKPSLEVEEAEQAIYNQDRKSTRLNSSHTQKSRMPSSA